MTPEESSLVSAVVASPEDDSPRLAYADWLDSHARGERAEFIRLQCQICHLQHREEELLKSHHQEWGAELERSGATHWKFHRGFPEEIFIGANHFITQHTKLNRHTPVRDLHLVGTNGHFLSQLAVLPVLTQVRTLELNRASGGHGALGDYSAANLDQLLLSPNLRSLQQLALHHKTLSGVDALHLATLPSLSGLKHLTLTGPRFESGDHSLAVKLSDAANVWKLRHLQLNDKTYGEKTLELYRSMLAPKSASPPRS